MLKMPLSTSDYEIIKQASFIEVKYNRAENIPASVYIYPDHIRVDAKQYDRKLIEAIYTKAPDFVERQAGHNPRPPRGFFARASFELGRTVKDGMLKSANATQWSVWFTCREFAYGEKINRSLASGFSKERADTLQQVFIRLLED